MPRAGLQPTRYRSAPRNGGSRLKRAEQPGPPRGLIALCVAVAVVAATPIIIAIVQALQGGFSAARASFTAGATRTLMLHSVEVAAVATPIAVVIGVTCAWFVERTRLPGRRIWAVLFVAPLTIPPFVTSYSWANLATWLQSYYGAVGIIAFIYFPIVYLLVAVALRGLDPALEETARSLGLSGTRTFFRVVLPQLRPALLGGALLVALDTLVEYDAFVALKFQAFSSNVYAQYQLGFSASGAAALSLTSIAVCLILVFGEARLRGHANYTRVSQGARRAIEPYQLEPRNDPGHARARRDRRDQRRDPRGHPERVVRAKQRRRGRKRAREPPVPAPGDTHLGRARCGGGDRRRGPCAPDCPRRGSLSTTGRDALRARHLPLLRTPRSRGGDRPRVRRQPLCPLPLRKLGPARPRRGGAVPPVRSRRAACDARPARALARGVRPLARRRSALELLAGHAAARTTGARRRRGARVRVHARRSPQRPGAPAALPATRWGPSSRPTARPSRSRRPHRSPPCSSCLPSARPTCS